VLASPRRMQLSARSDGVQGAADTRLPALALRPAPALEPRCRRRRRPLRVEPRATAMLGTDLGTGRGGSSVGRTRLRQQKRPFAGLLCKPSDGLEPSTPSLPWRFRSVTRVHARSLATHFPLQIGPFAGRLIRRETSRVSFLMCPFCVRVMLPRLTTHASGAVRRHFDVSEPG
jgi:hypothetical protein